MVINRVCIKPVCTELVFVEWCSAYSTSAVSHSFQ